MRYPTSCSIRSIKWSFIICTLLYATTAHSGFIIEAGATYEDGSSVDFSLTIPDSYAWTTSNIFDNSSPVITTFAGAGPAGSPTLVLADADRILITDDDDDLANGFHEWAVVFNPRVVIRDYNTYANEYHAGHNCYGDIPCEDRYIQVSSSSNYNDLTREAAAVPEPAVLALLGIGMLGFGFSRRKTKLMTA